jgi:hypothetical protein
MLTLSKRIGENMSDLDGYSGLCDQAGVIAPLSTLSILIIGCENGVHIDRINLPTSLQSPIGEYYQGP